MATDIPQIRKEGNPWEFDIENLSPPRDFNDSKADEEGRKILIDFAHDSLCLATGQDFGLNQEAWRKWMRENPGWDKDLDYETLPYLSDYRRKYRAQDNTEV